MTEPTTDQFREMVISAVEAIGNDLGPEDDWLPVMLMHTDEGFQILPLVDPDGEIDLAGQEGLLRVAALLEQLKPKIVARVQMGWGRKGVNDPETGAMVPGEERTEMLLVQVASEGFYEMWFTDIERQSDGPPRIVQWEQSEETTGPLAEALKLRIAGTN